MKSSLLLLLCSLVVATQALAELEEMPRSGFLPDEVYEQLEAIEVKKDISARRWLGPRLNAANFQRVLVEDVVIFPEPQPNAQVSAETLTAIRDYTTSLMREKTGNVFHLAEEPGPGVLRVRAALTGFLIKTEGMKAYEIMPVTAIFGGAKALTGKRDRDVWLFYETRFEDSVTGEVVGAAQRSVEGKELKGKKDQLHLDDMRDSLDQATDDTGPVWEFMEKES